jgi:hypothetical protein
VTRMSAEMVFREGRHGVNHGRFGSKGQVRGAELSFAVYEVKIGQLLLLCRIHYLRGPWSP